MLVKYIMNVFKKLFKGRKLNCNEVVKEVSNGKYKKLDTYLEEMNNKVADIAGIKGEVLWTNSNPISAFVGQTISINFSNYDMYEIIFYQSTSHNDRELSSGKLRTQKGGVLSYTPNNFFRAWMATNLSLTFEDTSDNNYLIPAYVIGYKTNLF